MKYLVVSYDDDQQQTFFDWVLAPTNDLANRALVVIGTLRDYATPCTALTSQELRDMADKMDAATEEQIAEAHAVILREACGEDTEHVFTDGEKCSYCEISETDERDEKPCEVRIQGRMNEIMAESAEEVRQ